MGAPFLDPPPPPPLEQFSSCPRWAFNLMDLMDLHGPKVPIEEHPLGLPLPFVCMIQCGFHWECAVAA